VIFALNETYCINEKGSLKLAATFPICPPDFEATITKALGRSGEQADELVASLEALAGLVEAVRKSTGL
jgi:hypothetical protein